MTIKLEVNFKVKYDFATSKGRSKSVRPLFRVILTGKFISAIIVMIQGREVNFKFKFKGKCDEKALNDANRQWG